MNRRSVLKLATTSLILAAPAIRASTGVFRPATTGNRYVVHVATEAVPLLIPGIAESEQSGFTGRTHNILLFDRNSCRRKSIDVIYTDTETPMFAMGEKLGAAVEEHRTVHGHFSAQFYPGATFNNHGDASYEDGRHYPKLIKMLPEPGEHTIKIPRLSA